MEVELVNMGVQIKGVENEHAEMFRRIGSYCEEFGYSVERINIRTDIDGAFRSVETQIDVKFKKPTEI